jgi:hypothetical protein
VRGRRRHSRRGRGTAVGQYEVRTAIGEHEVRAGKLDNAAISAPSGIATNAGIPSLL